MTALKTILLVLVTLLLAGPITVWMLGRASDSTIEIVLTGLIIFSICFYAGAMLIRLIGVGVRGALGAILSIILLVMLAKSYVIPVIQGKEISGFEEINGDLLTLFLISVLAAITMILVRRPKEVKRTEKVQVIRPKGRR